MAVKDPDSVTLFFQNPTNIHRLRVSQLLKLTDLQASIDELNAQNLSDFNLTNRDIQVGHLRNDMAVIVEGSMVDGVIVDRCATDSGLASPGPRHMTSTEGCHFG